MPGADDAIIEPEEKVNFNWARTLSTHHAATHTKYALALMWPLSGIGHFRIAPSCFRICRWSLSDTHWLLSDSIIPFSDNAAS